MRSDFRGGFFGRRLLVTWKRVNGPPRSREAVPVPSREAASFLARGERHFHARPGRPIHSFPGHRWPSPKNRHGKPTAPNDDHIAEMYVLHGIAEHPVLGTARVLRHQKLKD